MLCETMPGKRSLLQHLLNVERWSACQREYQPIRFLAGRQLEFLFSPPLRSSPYDFSKTIVKNVKENGEKTQGTGENPFWGFPYTCDGVLPSQSIPMAHPFWERHPWLDRVASLANSGAWGVSIVGKFIFSPSRGTPGLHQGAPLPSNPSWEDSHPWETSFSSRSRGSPASWVPLPINYFWEDAHPWEMVPLAIPPSGYLSWPLCDPSLICSFMYAPIYSKYIWFVKRAVRKNANKIFKKISLDSLHKFLSIPLKTP